MLRSPNHVSVKNTVWPADLVQGGLHHPRLYWHQQPKRVKAFVRITSIWFITTIFIYADRSFKITPKLVCRDLRREFRTPFDPRETN